jgi:hypothetical protein
MLKFQWTDRKIFQFEIHKYFIFEVAEIYSIFEFCV